jgi:hypothetical protein
MARGVKTRRRGLARGAEPTFPIPPANTRLGAVTRRARAELAMQRVPELLEKLIERLDRVVQLLERREGSPR